MYSLGELAQKLNATLVGDPKVKIVGIAPLQSAGPGEISFLDNPVYRKYLGSTKATAVIVSKDLADKCKTDALIVDNPYFTFAKAAELFRPALKRTQGVHPTAVVSESADIEEGAIIGPNAVVEADARIETGAVIGANAYIGEGVFIGRDTVIHPNVVIYHHCQVGCECTIHSCTVIGSDGFGIAKHQGRWHEIPQLGRVIIGNNVLIGANTAIDRGALVDTIVKDGVKIDNQVQIGHNVIINEHSVIAGCAGIAGSAEIGAHCIIGGDVGISGHIKIADNVSISGGTRVLSAIHEPGVYSSGMPVQENKAWHKTYVRIQQLDTLAKRIKALEKKSQQKEEIGSSNDEYQ